MNLPTIDANKLIDDPAFGRLQNRLVDVTGLFFYLRQKEDLAERIAARLAATGIRQLEEYVERLSADPRGSDEWDALVAELTIGETFFFRHREQFDALRDCAIPSLIKLNQPSRRLRIWSAGCATGAEPYSLAILLRNEFDDALRGWDVKILATDINREFLARGARGAFDEWALRALDDDTIREYFTRLDGRWLIDESFKRNIVFAYHNLARAGLPSNFNDPPAFDLILCRNVMIYFHPEVARATVDQFHGGLTPGGWLVVGHAESNVEFFRHFRTVNAPGAVLYEKPSSACLEFSEADFSQLAEAPPAARPIELPPRGGPKPRIAESESRKVPLRLPAASLHPDKTSTCSAPIDRFSAIRDSMNRAQWDQAAGNCDELVLLCPLDAAAHFYRALSLAQLSRNAEAERAMRRAIYLDRRFVLAHYHLALLLQKNCDVAGAKRSLHNTAALLKALDDTQTFVEANELTAGELRTCIQTHLEVLCQAAT